MDEPKINSDQPWKKKPIEPAAGDVEQQVFEQQKELDPNKCANCGAAPEPGHLVPLCKACRDKLSKYPVPIYIIIGLIAVLGLTVMAFMKFPQALQAGVAFSKGEKAEKAGKYMEACDHYFLAMDTYKDSTPLITRMGIAYCKAGEYEAAAMYLDKVAGREMSTSLAAEDSAAIAEINKYYDELDAKLKKKKPASKKPAGKKKGGAK